MSDPAYTLHIPIIVAATLIVLALTLVGASLWWW